MDDATVKALLKTHGLRATAPRMVVLRALAKSAAPQSWAELNKALGDDGGVDPATTYRNLLKLTEVGIAEVVGHFDGRDRYTLAPVKGKSGHQHPHFVCEDCGQVACLPDSVAQPKARGRWAASVRGAKMQLRGECPDCRQERRAS